MNSRRWTLVTAGCLAFLAGCGGGKFLELGRSVEERGEPQKAYEQFCRAAAEHPGSGSVAAGLSRVRGGASAFWESEALLEMDAGHYEDAWRMAMKALEIQPDSATTAQLIRQIQDQHPDQIASARQEWLQRGSPALATAIPTRRRVAQPPSAVSAEESPLAAPTLPPEPEVRLEPDASAEPPSQSASSRDAAKRASTSARKSVIKPSRPIRKKPAERRSAEDIDPAAAPPAFSEGPLSEPPDDSPRKAPRPPRSTGRGEFLMVQTLSLKESAYPRLILAVDDIEVRLKDTDADLEADFDLYAGRTRIKKIRNMKIGHSQAFAGATGRLYRLTLLGIHHKSRTVRIGIKPA